MGLFLQCKALKTEKNCLAGIYRDLRTHGQRTPAQFLSINKEPKQNALCLAHQRFIDIYSLSLHSGTKSGETELIDCLQKLIVDFCMSAPSVLLNVKPPVKQPDFRRSCSSLGRARMWSLDKLAFYPSWTTVTQHSMSTVRYLSCLLWTKRSLDSPKQLRCLLRKQETCSLRASDSFKDGRRQCDIAFVAVIRFCVVLWWTETWASRSCAKHNEYCLQGDVHRQIISLFFLLVGLPGFFCHQILWTTNFCCGKLKNLVRNKECTMCLLFQFLWDIYADNSC